MEPTNTSAASTRLIGPGELFSYAWNLFKANWQALVLIAIVPQLVNLVARLFAMTGIGVIIAIPVWIFGFVLSIVMVPALIDAVNRVSAQPGMKFPVVEQYKAGFRLFWPLILVYLMQALIVSGSMVLLVIPGIIVSVYVSLSYFVLVLEDKRGFAAFTSSYSLVKGRWWPVFGRMLFLGLMMIAFVIVAMVIIIPLSIFGGQLGSAIAGLAISIVITPLSMIYSYRLYLSLKETRSTEVPTGGFKKWLVAFLVLGIIALLTIPVIGIFALLKMNDYITLPMIDNPAYRAMIDQSKVNQ